MVTAILAFGSLMGWAFGRVGRWMISDAARFQAFYAHAILWLEEHGITVAGAFSENFSVGWLLRTAQMVTGRLNTTVSFWLVVLVYVILGLLEVDDFKCILRYMRISEDGAHLLD